MSYFIGVMSGTSLDGIDVALVDFNLQNQLRLVDAQTVPFDASLKEGLKQLITTHECHLQTLGELDVALGRAIALIINKLLVKHDLNGDEIVAIGSHGQTLFHHPEGPFPFSLQIGNGNVIAELTGITTITDFRQRDMVAGGQGAPLVPAFHKALFHSTSQNRVIVNIGGLSNITVIPADSQSNIIGFDTGPGNTLLDGWIQQHRLKSYDESGQWARIGVVNGKLLTLLLSDPYFNQSIPKSTGREYFNLNWLTTKLKALTEDIVPQDVQATLSALTATTIAKDIQHYAEDTDAIYVCGGGAHNHYLIKQLRLQLPNRLVATTEQIGLQPDWVEACAFAWLARQTFTNKTSNLPEITGANHPAILGAIYPSLPENI